MTLEYLPTFGEIGAGDNIHVDISDLDKVVILDNPDEVQPTIGPQQSHTRPETITVADNFVQTGDIGGINTPADFKTLYIDIALNGGLFFNRAIDFSQQFLERGGAKPHSAVVFDLTDPVHPFYY